MRRSEGGTASDESQGCTASGPELAQESRASADEAQNQGDPAAAAECERHATAAERDEVVAVQ